MKERKVQTLGSIYIKQPFPRVILGGITFVIVRQLNEPYIYIAHSRNSRRDCVCPPKAIPESNAKMLILLFYVLKRCFLGSLWVDRPSLSVSFRSGQLGS